MGDTLRYWRANKETSVKITGFVQEWEETKRRGGLLAEKYGGNKDNLYYAKDLGHFEVTGFVFDKAQPNPKLFIRLKNTTDGWRPRSIKSKDGSELRELQKEFRSLRSHTVSQVCNLIGFKIFDQRGLKWFTPGVHFVGKAAYIVTDDSMDNAIGCERISDIEFEKATAKKPTAKTAKRKAKATP